MLIVMKSGATGEEISRVATVVQEMGFRPHVMPGATRTAIGVTGNPGVIDPVQFENLPGVAEAIRVSKPYKLVTLDLRPEKTVVAVGEAKIGGDDLAIIAGPCAVENREKCFCRLPKLFVEAALKFLPRRRYPSRVTSPYAFQGLGDEGLKILSEVRQIYGLKIVAEALDDTRYGPGGRSNADMYSNRRAQHAKLLLLRRAGRSKPSGSAQAWHGGDARRMVCSPPNTLWRRAITSVVLCERGIRTFAQHTRNTLDLAFNPGGAPYFASACDCRSLPWHRQKLYGDAARLRRSRRRAPTDSYVEVHKRSAPRRSPMPRRLSSFVEYRATRRRSDGDSSGRLSQARPCCSSSIITIRSPAYNLVQYFGELGCKSIVRRNDAISVDEIARLKPAHICISPGPGRPTEAGISKEVVRRFAPSVPLLGVCLGHQCIAEVFGGQVVRAERLMHGKTSEIHHDGSGIFAGLPNPFSATRYHSLIVAPETLPNELAVGAKTAEGEIMGLQHREYPLHGVQFHPESILTAEGKKLLANFLAL